MIVYLFMDGSNQAYKILMRCLDQGYSTGEKEFPKDIEEALQLMQLFSDTPDYKFTANKMRNKRFDSPSLSFVQKVTDKTKESSRSYMIRSCATFVKKRGIEPRTALTRNICMHKYKKMMLRHGPTRLHPKQEQGYA